MLTHSQVTPLHVASIEDHYEVARCLIQAGACVSKPDSRGDLPIHWAATVGHSDVSAFEPCCVSGRSNSGSAVMFGRKPWLQLHSCCEGADLGSCTVGSKSIPQLDTG